MYFRIFVEMRESLTANCIVRPMPRILKLPLGWRFSNLRKTSRPTILDMAGLGTRGVVMCSGPDMVSVESYPQLFVLSSGINWFGLYSVHPAQLSPPHGQLVNFNPNNQSTTSYNTCSILPFIEFLMK